MPVTGSTMKWIIGASVILGLTLGVLAGYLSSGSSSAASMVLTGIAVWIVCQLLFGLWVRSRAQPAAGDRVVLPNLAFGAVGMLLTILPQLFWPSAERVHIAAAVVGCVVIIVGGVRQIRRRRQLRMLRNMKGHP